MKYDNFIPKNEHQFISEFGNDIAELRFATGGIAIEEEGKYAKAVVYENPFHKIENKNVITFGYFDSNDKQLANKLFTQLKALAKDRGYSAIVGPINGSTWFDYRLMVPNENSLFFTEAKTPSESIEILKDNGFEVLKQYTSNYSLDLKAFDLDFLNKKEEELARENWSVRGIDLENLEDELRQIARFSNDSFRYNFLYSPIEVNDFVKKYIKILPQIDTQFVKIIRNENKAIEALIFAFPDLLSKEKQFIIKTVSRNPESKIKGLGNYLCQLVTKMAYEQGYKSAIHAYIAQNNSASNTISSGFLESKSYRNYLLFICKLG